MLNPTDKEARVRHSFAHVLAMAVLKLYPQAKLGMGPAIENGFYYDFGKIKNVDLEKIEKEMIKILETDFRFQQEFLDKKTASKLFKGQNYKKEIIKDLKENSVSIYKSGDFLDLCQGPHVESSADLKPNLFKLYKVAGAYWKSQEKNDMLTRIYGLAFEKKEDLIKHLEILKEAKKRDHRKLGKELGLFVFSDLVGPGLPLYTPRGAIVRTEIQNLSRKLRQEMNYQEVCTPQINREELFKLSGHYEKYRGDMFKVKSNHSPETFYLKPMNCPQHCQIYGSKTRSYRDLPIKFSDFANLYRDEKPGELSGLTRLRSFSQDDGHCFSREDQIEKEFELILSAIKKSLEKYGLNYYLRLSLRDKKNQSQYLGDDKIWEKSQRILEKILKKSHADYIKAPGEATFYGPKIDLIAKDALNREWQLSTIQLDFNMPERFGLKYIDELGKKQTPVMIHSALIGSPERFMAILLEHYNGALPFWLSPEQIWILPISEKHLDYAKKIQEKLADFRSLIKSENETLSNKIRKGQEQKIPFLLIVGDKEKKEDLISVRSRDEGELGQMAISEFAARLTPLKA